MNPLGWMFLLLSWGLVLSLFGYCLYVLFRKT